MSYDAFASTFSQSRKNLRWGEIEYFVECMKKDSSHKKISLLDVGCGNGRFLETLAVSGLSYDYLGTDESKGMITEARKLHPTESFEVIDMNNIESLSGQKYYDYIVFIASFHHLQKALEREQVLQNVKKLLAPDGIIMMTNWNLLGAEMFPKYEKSHRWSGDFGIKIGEHERYYHGFELQELENLFAESGLHIIENRIFEGGKNIISIIKA